MSGTLPSDTEVVRAFAEAMAQAGLPPPEHIKADGRLHRFPTNGQRSDDAGYYILHLDGMPAGYFGCWRSDVAQAWHAARRAAEAVDGWVAVPELDGRPCDFNDLCWARGPEAVKEALGTAQAVSSGGAQPTSGSEQAFDREVDRLAELHPKRYERERAAAAKVSSNWLQAEV